MEEKWLACISVRNASFLGEISLVDFTAEVSLGFENLESVIKSIELKEVLDKFRHKSTLVRFSQNFSLGVLEVERAFA